MDGINKASIYTIAQRVGVSAATVSRALSGQGRVRPETRQRILAAAEELNYRPSRLARRLSGPEITIVVFYAGMHLEEFGLDIFRGAYDACQELADYHVRVRMCYLPNMMNFRAKECEVEQIIRILESGVRGAINLPIFSDEAQNARIQQVVQERGIALAQTVHSRDKGNPIFSYQSDVYTAGAIAAELLWNILGDGGKVSIFTTQKDLPFYAAGIRGFRDAMQRYPLDLLVIYENYDDRQIAYHATDALLRNYPDVRGIFVGSTNSKTVCQRIAESPHPEEISLITSDLYPELVPYIERRMVRATIIQAQYTQAFEAFRALANYLITHIPAEQPVRMVRPQIVLHSNVEQFLTPMSDKRVAACLAAIERIET